jgi:hypothetical protein
VCDETTETAFELLHEHSPNVGAQSSDETTDTAFELLHEHSPNAQLKIPDNSRSSTFGNSHECTVGDQKLPGESIFRNHQCTPTSRQSEIVTRPAGATVSADATLPRRSGRMRVAPKRFHDEYSGLGSERPGNVVNK